MPYLFGDSDPAARRLEIVHQVFAPTSQSLLQRFAREDLDLAVDLGCSQGLSTHLLLEATRCRSAVGLDTSAAFIELANARPHPAVSFVVHDVTLVPFPVEPADMLYARLLVGHLAQPDVVLAHWSSQLRSAGRLVIEEVESMATAHPVLRHYLDILRQLQAHHRLAQCFGPTLHEMPDPDGLTRELSRVTRVPVTPAMAASMFRINLRTWRQDDFVRTHFEDSEIDELQNQLDRVSQEEHGKPAITWGIRQVVYRRVGTEATERLI